MKRKVNLLLVFSFLMLLCACSQQPAASSAAASSTAASSAAASQSASSGQPLLSTEGYTAITNTKNATFQYPKGWVEVSADMMTKPEMVKELEEKLGISEEVWKQSISQTDAIVFDASAGDEAFVPSINMVSADAPGLTQKQLQGKEALASLKLQLNTLMSQSFEKFAFTSELENKTLGDNTFVVYQMNYSLSGLDITAYQAITADDDRMYTFTYSTKQGKLSADKVKEVDTILSTVKLS